MEWNFIEKIIGNSTIHTRVYVCPWKWVEFVSKDFNIPQVEAVLSSQLEQEKRRNKMEKEEGKGK